MLNEKSKHSPPPYVKRTGKNVRETQGHVSEPFLDYSMEFRLFGVKTPEFFFKSSIRRK